MENIIIVPLSIVCFSVDCAPSADKVPLQFSLVLECHLFRVAGN